MKKRVESRFGSIAVDKGFITMSQLIDALSIQAKENVEQGKHRLLGQILLDQGHITEAQIDEVLETMNHAMMYVLSASR
jgi:hypothetical protein